MLVLEKAIWTNKNNDNKNAEGILVNTIGIIKGPEGKNRILLSGSQELCSALQ